MSKTISNSYIENEKKSFENNFFQSNGKNEGVNCIEANRKDNKKVNTKWNVVSRVKLRKAILNKDQNVIQPAAVLFTNIVVCCHLSQLY